MINNIIIFTILCVCILLYSQKKIDKMLIVIGISYVCMPVIKIGVNNGINSAYVLTFVLTVLFVHSFLFKRLIFRKEQLVYLISMVLSVLLICIGWLLNGVPSLSGLIHFAGMSQYILGVFIFSVFVSSYDVEKKDLFKKIFGGIILLNYVLVFLQMVYPILGKEITKYLYTYEGKTAPLEAVDFEWSGRFVRSFGTFYSPTVLGIVSLLLAIFFLREITERKKVLKLDVVFYVLSVGLGLLAFSKMAIIGNIIIIFINVLLEVGKNKGRRVSCIALKTVTIILIVYFGTAGLQCLLGFTPYVQYYYIDKLNVFAALETRYGNLFSSSEMDMETETNAVEIESSVIETETSVIETEAEVNNIEDEIPVIEGNTLEAFDIFRKHPIIGVGPMSIEGEFLGDSEYISILHNGGILAFGAYGCCYGYLILWSFVKKRKAELLTLFGVGMGAVSIMVFSYGCIIPFVAYCLCEHKTKDETTNI